MTLKDLLAEKKTIILDRWFGRSLEVYPQETRDFFRENRSPFSNPIGSTLRESMEGLYEEMLQPSNSGKTRALLESIVRMRAVENLSPSQALAFIPLLKEMIVGALKERNEENHLHREWAGVSAQIDRLTLQAFDLYMECREKIYQLRLKELNHRESWWLRRDGQ